jgi:hypothetical protein
VVLWMAGHPIRAQDRSSEDPHPLSEPGARSPELVGADMVRAPRAVFPENPIVCNPFLLLNPKLPDSVRSVKLCVWKNR